MVDMLKYGVFGQKVAEKSQMNFPAELNKKTTSKIFSKTKANIILQVKIQNWSGWKWAKITDNQDNYTVFRILYACVAWANIINVSVSKAN